MTISTVFISAVSSELREYRQSLAAALRGADLKVILQEELSYQADTLLGVLDDAIRQSQAAICLIGDGSGAAFPSAKEAEPYAHLLAPEQELASHTQFEILLARQYKLQVLVFYPDDALTLPPPHPNDDRALQARFKTWLEAEGVPRLTFDGHRDLAAKVLAQLHRIEHPTGPITHGLPPSLGARFVGREDFLVQIRQTLAQSNTTAITAAISGMGGIGKTRAAAEYAWAHQADYPGGMFMIPAATSDSLLTHLSNLTTPLGIAGMDTRPPEERRAAVVNWLRTHRDWLLILDHVDTDDGMQAAHDLRGDLPAGHVLLTSRLTSIPTEFHGLSLGVLSPEAATRFLLETTKGKRAPAPDDEAQARGLAEDLGGLALALTHAAAYVERHRMSLSAYRAELARIFERVLGFKSKTVKDHADSTLATLEVSLGRATPAGRALLERLAFLADEPVPRFLLEVPVPGDDADQREAEADLADYSLVARDAGSGSFTTHRLVREVVRRRLTEAEARNRLDQALRWVDDAFEGNPQDARTWPRLLPLAEHAETVADRADKVGIHEPTARLMAELGVLFHARAQYARAERLMRAALAIGERSLGPDHPEVATSLNNLAELLQATNRLAEAEPLYRRALAIDEASLGPDHPTVAIRLNNLAGLLRATNRLAEAEKLYRRALAIDEPSLGPDHPNVATSLNNLAGLLQATNRLAEAEPLCRRALAISEASLGPDHPDVAIRLNNLAGLLRATNRLAEAEPLFRRALAIDEASLGPDHPEVATDLNNLAGLLRATNRLAEAEKLYRRALAIDDTSLGPDHPNVATGLNNLAGLLEATNRLAEAEPLSRRALAISEASLGPDHPTVAIRLNNLAAMFRATGRLAEAVPLFRRAVMILLRFQRATTHQHPNFEAVLGHYVAALQALGRTEAEITADVQAMAREAGLG